MSTNEKLLAALLRVERMIFARGAPLGSDNYFAIREVLREAVTEEPVPSGKKRYRVRVTRDCTFTQSVDVILVATSPDAAEGAAVDLPQSGLAWEHDPDSYHYGETGTYIADPGSTAEAI